MDEHVAHDNDAKAQQRARARERSSRLEQLLEGDEPLQMRLRNLMSFGRRVRPSEYHLTNACNLRCKGCWFFEFGHDVRTREVSDLRTLEEFIIREKSERRINTALIIGGEPTLFPERIRLFVKHMKYVNISSNGLQRLPPEGFENVTIGLTLFAGGPLDDELRAIKPSGLRFSGLFDRMLANYRNDVRAQFIYALTDDGIDYIEETVRKIHANGNRVTFNFYSKYDTREPTQSQRQEQLLAEALRVRELFPDTVVCHPYYVRTVITGNSHWGKFGYENCPSISIDHPAHTRRLANGNASLNFFNTWAADLKTVEFCCTSGHCEDCRDSQAVYSWLLVSMEQFLESKRQLTTWIEIAESYWRQFSWSPYNSEKSGYET